MPEIKRPLVSALVVGVALSLGACTNEPAPIVTATPTPTVESPTPSPTPSVTTDGELTREQLLEILPSEAVLEDIRGPQAMADYFLVNYPRFINGELLDVFDAITMDGCVFCESIASLSDEFAELDKTYKGGDIRIDDLDLGGLIGPDGDATIRRRIHEEPFEVLDRNGAVIESSQGSVHDIAVKLTFVEGVWRVVDAGFRPEE